MLSMRLVIKATLLLHTAIALPPALGGAPFPLQLLDRAYNRNKTMMHMHLSFSNACLTMWPAASCHLSGVCCLRHKGAVPAHAGHATSTLMLIMVPETGTAIC